MLDDANHMTNFEMVVHIAVHLKKLMKMKQDEWGYVVKFNLCGAHAVTRHFLIFKSLEKIARG